MLMMIQIQKGPFQTLPILFHQLDSCILSSLFIYNLGTLFVYYEIIETARELRNTIKSKNQSFFYVKIIYEI